MSSEVKQIKITGQAADSYTKPRKGTRKQARVQEQEGGKKSPNSRSNIPPGPQITSHVNVGNAAPLMAKSNTLFGTTPQRAGSVPQSPLPLTPATQAAATARTLPPVPALAPVGGGKKGKLELVPAKKKTSRVLLAPPTAGSSKFKRSVKTTRKIRMQLGGLKKRFTRAKDISKESRSKSIAEIRTALEQAKLIKPLKEGSKGPPEGMLRDIYKDYMMLRNKAL